MLGNVQYTAFYKFLVSVGLVLIALGIVIPWLLLHESFDLLVKQADLSQLTPKAQETIRQRQAIVHLGSVVSPWISLILIVAGLTVSGVGLDRWRRRQAVMDRTEDVALEKLRAETHVLRAEPATPPERDAKRSAEAWEIVREQADQASALELQSPATVKKLDEEYRQLRRTIGGLEDIAVTKMRLAFGSTHTIVAQGKLGEKGQQVLLDAVLTPQRSTDPGYIIELEYVSSGKSLDRVASALVRLSAARRLYRATALIVYAVLLVIVADKETQLMSDLRAQIPSPAEPLRLITLYESQLGEMSPEDLRSLIEGATRTISV